MTRDLLTVAAVWQGALGLSLLFGGHAYESPSYRVLFELTPPAVQGVMLLVGAAVAYAGVVRPGTRLCGFRLDVLGFAWAAGHSSGWAASFVLAGFLGYLSGPSAPITYGAVAAIYTLALRRSAL